MTYGVYTRDLKSYSLSGQYSIDNCKKYLWRDTDVVCSERRIRCAWVVKFIFHKWRGFHYWKYDKMWILGFVSIVTHSNYYTGADKIVYDPQATKGGAK
jgi:hypothetical protein